MAVKLYCCVLFICGHVSYLSLLNCKPLLEGIVFCISAAFFRVVTMPGPQEGVCKPLLHWIVMRLQVICLSWIGVISIKIFCVHGPKEYVWAIFSHWVDQSQNCELFLQMCLSLSCSLCLSPPHPCPRNIYNTILPLSLWNAIASFIIILILIFFDKKLLFIWRISYISFQILIILRLSSQNKINILNLQGTRESSLHLLKCYFGCYSEMLHGGWTLPVHYMALTLFILTVPQPQRTSQLQMWDVKYQQEGNG